MDGWPGLGGKSGGSDGGGAAGGKPDPGHLAETGPCTLMLPSLLTGNVLRQEEQVAPIERPSRPSEDIAGLGLIPTGAKGKAAARISNNR